MRPLGVLYVVPEIDRTGGYELVAVETARQLARRGAHVVVLVHDCGGQRRVPDEPGVEVVRLRQRGRRTLVTLAPRLATIMAARRATIDVVLCQTFSFMSGLAIAAGEALRLPSAVRVATESDVSSFAQARDVKRRLFWRLLCRARVILATSSAIVDELRAAGVPSGRVMLRTNSVDVGRFRAPSNEERRAARKAAGIPDDGGIVVGTVARLVERKAVDVLLRAFAAARIVERGARLLVVGDGPERGALEGLARTLGIAGALLLPGERADVAPWLHAMDVFAFPSRLEGSPNAVLEAMASALPIVASRIGGTTDLVEDGRNALLVPAGSVEDLARALVALTGDDAMRRALGAAARADAEERLSIDRSIDELMALLRRLAHR